MAPHAQTTRQVTMPADCKSCAAANSCKPGAFVTVMGLVVDIMPSARTKGTDWMLTFTLCDGPSDDDRYRIRFFSPDPDWFPPIKGKGDVVFLRDLRMSLAPQYKCGVSNRDTMCYVLRIDDVPETHSRNTSLPDLTHLPYHQAKWNAEDVRPTSGERRWAMHLKAKVLPLISAQPPKAPLAMRDAPTSPVNGSTTRSPAQRKRTNASEPETVQKGDKFALIENIRDNQFFDLIGEVCKTFFNSFGSYLELYLTDYTAHRDLMDFPADSADCVTGNIPCGKMTLHIELHPPHSSTIIQENIDVGDVVYLRNVRVKRSRAGYLEANMWKDSRYPNKVCVSRMEKSHVRYKAFKDRKDAYRSRNLANIGHKSKKRKTGKENKKYSGSGPATAAVNNTSDTNVTAEQNTAKEYPPRKNVETINPDQTFSEFSKIIDNPNRKVKTTSGVEYSLPFVNAVHLTRLRVLDFYPHDVRNFSIPVNESKTNWVWDFWLVVCAGDRNDSEQRAIHVEVSGKNAEFLLGVHATDLRANHSDLVKLKEILFLLWGPLGETKDRFIASHPYIKVDEELSTAIYNIAVENRPFEACIAEYGVLVPSRNPVARKDGDMTIGDDEAAKCDAEGDESEAANDWMRCWKLVDTRILGYA